jgi:hypothetical protein
MDLNVGLDADSEEAREANRLARALVTARSDFESEGGQRIFLTTLSETVTWARASDDPGQAARRTGYLLFALSTISWAGAMGAVIAADPHGEVQQQRVFEWLAMIFIRGFEDPGKPVL